MTATPVITQWTGHLARSLRLALRMTTEEFADLVQVCPRQVKYWNARPGIVPQPSQQRALDRALSAAPAAARERFTLALQASQSAPASVLRAAEARRAELAAQAEELARELARLDALLSARTPGLRVVA